MLPLMLTIGVPLLAAVLGAFIYQGSGNQKTAEIGKMLCFAGMLWLVYVVSAKSLHF